MRFFFNKANKIIVTFYVATNSICSAFTLKQKWSTFTYSIKRFVLTNTWAVQFFFLKKLLQWKGHYLNNHSVVSYSSEPQKAFKIRFLCHMVFALIYFQNCYETSSGKYRDKSCTMWSAMITESRNREIPRKFLWFNFGLHALNTWVKT